jgi:hypothetical protein
LHISLLFASLAADFAFDKVGRSQPRGLIKPAGQHHVVAKAAGFARQDYENRLSDFFGVMGISSESQRSRINQIHIPRDEGGKRRFGFGAGELLEQFMIVQLGHLPVRCP